MTQRVCVVTGASSGIGKEIARGVAAAGARTVLVVRNRERGDRAAAEIEGDTELAVADLAELAQVRALAATLQERLPRIDVLVNNAGVYRWRRSETKDGIEETLAVNQLAPFLLTNLLLDRLRASAPARIVTVASEAHHNGTIDLDDLEMRRRYGAWRAYARSKLANIMFTYALARRLEGSGVNATCLHPGFVATNLGSGPLMRYSPLRLGRLFLRGPREGADTAVWLATTTESEPVNGGYYDDRRERASSRESYDEEAQERLWRRCEELTGLSNDPSSP